MSNLKLTNSGLRVLRRNETRLYSVIEALWIAMKLGYISVEEWHELHSVRHGASFTVEVTQQLSVLALLAEGYDVWAEGELAEFRKVFNTGGTAGVILYSQPASRYMATEDYAQTGSLYSRSDDAYDDVRQMFAGFVLLSEGYDL